MPAESFEERDRFAGVSTAEFHGSETDRGPLLAPTMYRLTELAISWRSSGEDRLSIYDFSFLLASYESGTRSSPWILNVELK